jgi:hypothetical protein
MKPTFLFAACFLLLHTTGVAADSWKAGAAGVAITPETNMWMAGYASRKEPGSGKLTNLWAKALVLEDGSGNRGVIVTLDLVGIDRELAARVCGKLKETHGFSREQVALCFSHTHSGPVVGKNLGPLHYWLLDEAQQRLIDSYAESLVGHIETVVGKALARLAPSRLQWGSGLCTFAVNRRENKPYPEVPERRTRGELAGPVDHDVPVLSVRDPEGRLTAILFGYACHATTLGGQEWCGDYPGYAQAALESAHPGCTALFWAGCGADQNPLPRREVELAQEYGDELAEAVEETLAAPMPELAPRLDLHFREVPVPLAQLPTREELQLQAVSATSNRYESACARSLLRELEQRGALDPHYPYPIGLWRFGNQVEWITLGGEVVIDYALRFKRERHGEGTWVAGFSHDVMAYVPSLRVLQEGGYEGGGSNVYYGFPALWSEQAEETIVGALPALQPTRP